MKVLQVIRGRDFRILDLPVPDVGPGEVRVRVDAISICTQWDLHLRHNDPMYPGHQFNYPYTPGQPGHEASGTIDAVGEGVTELQVGQRVSVWRDPGHHLQGAYAQFMVRPVHDVIAVPASLPAVATAPVELAMCVACSVLQMKRMGAITGKRCAVLGLGPAGQIAGQMLRAEGAASIVGIDPVQARRSLADDWAEETWAPDQARESLPLRPDALIDSAIDCVGAKATVEFLMDRTLDVVQLFGVQREDYAFTFRHYIGLCLCGYPPHRREAAEYAVRLITDGKLDLRPLITDCLPLERYGEAIDRLERQEALKICLLPWAAEG